MAAGAVRHILYKLDLAGTLPTQLVPLRKRLGEVDTAASKTGVSVKGMGEIFKSAASKMGGATASLTEFGATLTNVIGGVGGTTGAILGLSAGVALAAAGTVALTRATKQWLDSASEANKRLKEAGLATTAQTDAIDDYSVSSKRFGLALDQVHVAVASLVAGPFADMLDTLSGLLGIIPSITSALDRLRNAFPGKAAAAGLRAALGFATLGASEALRFGAGMGADVWGSMGGTTAPITSPSGGVTDEVLMRPGRTVETVSPVSPSAPRRDFAAATPIDASGSLLDAQLHLTRAQFEALNHVANISVQSLTQWDDAVGRSAVAVEQQSRRGVGEFLRGPAPGALSTAAAFSSLNANGPMLGQIGAMFGPMGAAIGTLADNFREVPDILRGLGDQIVGVFLDLPGVLIELIPMIVTELIPGIITGLAKGFVNAIKDLFGGGPSQQEQVASDLRARGVSEEDILTVQDARRRQAALMGNAAAAVGLPSYAVGGNVPADGMYRLHKGEHVDSAAQVSRGRGSRGGNVTIVINESQDPRRTTESVRRALGSYGLGLSLDPLV